MKKLVDLRPVDIGSDFEVECIVTEISDVISVITQACFKCNSCGHFQFLNQDGSEVANTPLECPKDEEGCGKRLGVTSFMLDPMKSLHVATQLIEVQDAQYQSSRQLVRKVVILEEELVEKVEPGDIITLKYKPRGKQIGKNMMKFELILEGGEIKHHDKMNSQPKLTDEEKEKFIWLDKQDAWNLISQSIAPKIVRCEAEKRILALALFSGIEQGDSISVLWIGEPGIAKSEVLLFMSQVLPRGQFTVGGQATHARLVGTATQGPDGKWTIKAGKFVIANKSIHCIDEIGEFDRKTLGAFREVMAQQTVHVDKGDKSVNMKANEILIAAMNPKGDRFNDSSALISQIDTTKMSSALISRFGWLLFGLDTVDSKRDREVAGAIIDKSNNKVKEPPISLDLLRKLVLIRRDIQPSIPDDVREYIVGQYDEMRQHGQMKYEVARDITPRQIETVVRSIRALVRIRGRRKAEKKDADDIIELYKSNLKSVTNGSMNIDDIFTVSSQDDRTMVEKVMSLISDGGRTQEELDEEFGEDVSGFVDKLSRRGDIFFNAGKFRKV